MQIVWPTNIQSLFQETLDSLIAPTMLGQTCVLYFPPLNLPCPNAPTNVGNFSTDTWAAGNPLPVHAQDCPLCHGENMYAVATTGSVNMIIYWFADPYKDVGVADERTEAGPIRTKGYVSDLHKILNCTYMEAYTAVGRHYKFKLAGEPAVPGKLVPERYFFAMWNRI